MFFLWFSSILLIKNKTNLIRDYQKVSNDPLPIKLECYILLNITFNQTGVSIGCINDKQNFVNFIQYDKINEYQIIGDKSINFYFDNVCIDQIDDYFVKVMSVIAEYPHDAIFCGISNASLIESYIKYLIDNSEIFIAL